MTKHQLTTEKRKVAGKKVKDLRKQGIMPANIYGKKIQSLAVQLPLKEFEKAFKEVGETGLLDLCVAGETKPRPVLIHNVQLDPITSQPLHTDFFQVDLKEKVTARVSVVIIGEALAVKDKKGVLLHTLNEIEVEALPADLPEKIEVDISKLVEVDQEIKLADLKIPPGVAILTDAASVVCKIGSLVTAEMKAEMKKEEETAAATAAEAAAAAPVAETAEAQAPPVPGEKLTEEAKPTEEKPAQPKGKKE